jgi:hypothetical protein
LEWIDQVLEYFDPHDEINRAVTEGKVGSIREHSTQSPVPPGVGKLWVGQVEDDH